jgi:hypothetical protein
MLSFSLKGLETLLESTACSLDFLTMVTLT